MAKFYYGGQAVVEGVMMRGQKHMAVAVRAPDGSIALHQETLRGVLVHPVMKLPLLRGLVGLWDALGLGMKALLFSASVASQDEEENSSLPHNVEAEAQGAAATMPVGIAPAVQQKSGQFGGAAAWGSIAVALAMMVGIFFVLPVLAASFFTDLAGARSSLAHNLTEGAIRLGLFLGYLALIGRMKDVQRVFGYHGAEHKTINAYEAGVPLTPEQVQKFTLLNPRCGTTFLLIVMLMATAVFVVVGKLPFIVMVLSRIVLVPLIAAVAYEFIRLMANLYDHALVRALLAPGIALQKMTTRPPDHQMLEVAIVALNAVLVADGVVSGAPAHVGGLQTAEDTLAEPAATLA
ncbi:MAG TPA: DUF1385 domain-containing protein [Chloroflexia bacterium]|nr:DUF1385 domain-containing protein [Chloroflexia bacterium]